MANIVKMDYELMERMAQQFQDGAQQLDDTMRVALSIAGTLEDGALLGQTGDTFSYAIRCQLHSAVGRLRDKLEELSQDVMGAMLDLRDSDSGASSRFKG